MEGHLLLIAVAWRKTSQAILSQMQKIVCWQIFNVLAGNSDGHAKNLSNNGQPDNGT